MSMSDGHSFDCCGCWNTYCAAGKGCKYMTDDFEFATLCAVFNHFYININPEFITKWKSQIDENGNIIVKESPTYAKKTQAIRDADLIISKLKGNDSMDDIMKLLGL